MRIVMNNGVVHEGHCTLTKGEPTRPHTPADLTTKFFELGEPYGASQRRSRCSAG